MTTTCAHYRSGSRIHSRGFTLLELVISVAIVGILVSLALPSYQRYLHRAKAVDLVLRIDAMRTAVKAAATERNVKIGTDVAVFTQLNNGSGAEPGVKLIPMLSFQKGTLSGPRSGADLVAGISDQMLDASALGLVVLSLASENKLQPDQQYLLVQLVWGTNPEGKQNALAVLDAMKSVIAGQKIGTNFAQIKLTL